MIFNTKRAIALIISLAMLLCAFTVTASAKKISQSDIDALQNQINRADAEIDKLANNKSELEQQRAELAKQLAELQNETEYNAEKKRLLDLQLQYVMSELTIAQELIMQCENELAMKNSLLESTATELEEQKTLFVELFRSNYESGSSKLKYLEILLTSRSISDFILNLQYIGSILDYEQHLLESTESLMIMYESQVVDLEETQKEQSLNKAVLEEKKELVDIVSAETALYIQKLYEDMEQAKEIHDKLHDDELAVLDELKELEDKKDDLIYSKEELEEEYLEQLRKEEEEKKRQEEEEKRKQEEANKNNQSSGGNTSSSGGLMYENGWCFPVDYNKAKYTDNFGWRPDPFGSSKRVYHHGIDLALGAGNNIYAVDSGTVLISKYSSTLGNYVVILHANGYKTYYAHASKLYAKVGDRVSRGEVIALVGTTGSSTGNHLHFAVVTPDGDYTDPENFFGKLLGAMKKYYID